MCRDQHKESRITHTKNIAMMPPKETKKALISNTKEIDICELLDKELRIILLKSLVNYKNS